MQLFCCAFNIDLQLKQTSPCSVELTSRDPYLIGSRPAGTSELSAVLNGTPPQRPLVPHFRHFRRLNRMAGTAKVLSTEPLVSCRV